ncbi:hypothetical protein [Pseudoxanthomonas kalamensis]|uniref:hypothetical protein n=1 Tax=Pseudoxanthomonas kalamensis TaxID=289483 RepID=UPI0013908CE0|nr:hypothetical protein [Pseudoxanthomonas kalamensis]
MRSSNRFACALAQLPFDASAPAGHRLLIFADSTTLSDDACAAGDSIRFQRNDATESDDSMRPLVVKPSFRHGNMGGGGTFNKAEGYDHQSSYNDSRAQWATLYSIAKLAQLADWHAQ